METTTSPYGATALDRSELRRGVALSWDERILLVLEVILAIGALAGAAGVVFGDILGDTTEVLPFGSALFAGIALATINGLWPLIVAIGALRHRRWSAWGHLSVGVGLMGWIVVQIYFLGPPVHWLQILYFTLGLVVAGVASRLLLVRRRSAN